MHIAGLQINRLSVIDDCRIPVDHIENFELATHEGIRLRSPHIRVRAKHARRVPVNILVYKAVVLTVELHLTR